MLILTIVYGLPVHKRSFGNVAGNNEEPELKAINRIWPEVFPLADQIISFDASGLPDLIENQKLPLPNIRITGPGQDAIFRGLLVTTVNNKGRLRQPNNQPEQNPSGFTPRNVVGYYAFLHKKAFINGETMATNDFEEGLERVNTHIAGKPRFSDTDDKTNLENAIKTTTFAMFKRYSDYHEYENIRIAGNTAGMTEIDPVTGEISLVLINDPIDLDGLEDRLNGVRSQVKHAKVYGWQRQILNTLVAKHSDVDRAKGIVNAEIARVAALDPRITVIPPGCRKRDGCTFDPVLESFPEFKNVKIAGLSPPSDYEKIFLIELKDALGHPDLLPDFNGDINADYDHPFDLDGPSIFKGATTSDEAWNHITDLIIADMDNPNGKLTKQRLKKLLGAWRFAHLSRDTKLSNDQDPNPQEAASYEIHGQNINRILDKTAKKYGSLSDTDDNGDNDANMLGLTSTSDDKIAIKEFRNAFDQHNMDKSDALKALSTLFSNKVKIPTDDDVVDEDGERVIKPSSIIPEATDDISLWDLASDYFIAELKEDMPNRQFKRLRLFLSKFASAINNLDKSIEQKIAAGIPISMEEYTSYKSFRENFERCKGVYTKFDKNIVLRKPEVGDPDKDPDTGDTIIYFDVPDTKSEMTKFTPEGRNKAHDTKAFKRNPRTSSTKKPIRNGRSNTTKPK